MIRWLIAFLFFVPILNAQSQRKKLPSISYQNLIQCYPELKDPKFEFGVELPMLKKAIDQKYPSVKSTLRYRKILFTDPKLGTERHRLTISLQKWVKGQAQYDYYLEKLDKDNIGEMLAREEKFKNPLREAPEKFLLNATLVEDESLLVDTKPNELELSYKTSNDSVVELDLSQSNGKVQLKCDSKKTQGVLCLCLKR
ncbi:MAG: hypothetical protein JNL11_06635 [Bdellovibrionaceae bacterium]|nr:hypothetical protein [Pseudobdellovibrionaceae bacterium]